MSAYDELVERCELEFDSCHTAEANVRRILAEVLRTIDAWSKTDEFSNAAFHTDCSRSEFISILNTSPLAPPKC